MPSGGPDGLPLMEIIRFMKHPIDRTQVDQAMSYASYRDLIASLLIERKTTGSQQSKKLVEYTRLNAARMDRVTKKTAIIPELMEVLRNLPRNQVWIGLVEAWCGDVAQSVPVFAKMAVSVPGVTLRLLLRDDNPEVMDAYLTNGRQSIPKIIGLDKDSLEELWVWGPRPEPAQSLSEDLKKQGESSEDIAIALQRWYNEDRSQTLQHEVLDLLKKI